MILRTRSMLQAVRDVVPQCSVGKILVERDEETALPQVRDPCCGGHSRATSPLF